MRKPLLTQQMVEDYTLRSSIFFSLKTFLVSTTMVFLMLASNTLDAQCVPSPGTIEGDIFLDNNINGDWDAGEPTFDQVVIAIYSSNGDLVTAVSPDASGHYAVSSLTDGHNYRIELHVPDHLSSTVQGADHNSDIAFLASPSCDVTFGAADPTTYCESDNPQIAVSCFVRGPLDTKGDLETIISTEYKFGKSSAISKLASKNQTGSVWGMAWRSAKKELYSAAFIKQNAYLGNGADAIYKTIYDPAGSNTSLWVNLVDLGVDAGTTTTANPENCDYGSNVGKVGIGGLDLSEDESTLYAVNLYHKSLVAIDLEDPTTATTMEVMIPDPSCDGGEYRPFAVKAYQGKIYVGVTCDASVSGASADHSLYIYSYNPISSTFTLELTTDFSRHAWRDKANNTVVGHWLTDIEFTTDGNMVLGIMDRTSHRYCAGSPLLNQFPDILLAWNNNGTWELERNGRAGALKGSGQGNGQGPGGGEFFGEEYWILGPNYHPEIATGSVFSLPGSNEVVASVFDPIFNTFSGGFHRYNTLNGKKTGAIELYTDNASTFGKASGLGNIIDLCEPAPLEIGNFVWIDVDGNGVQNGGEQAITNLELTLYDDNCQVVAKTTTNNEGQYFFNNSNVDLDQDGSFDGLAYFSNYTIVVSDIDFNKGMSKLFRNGEEYEVAIHNNGVGGYADNHDSDAELAQGSCAEFEGQPAVTVATSGSGRINHSFDLGFTPKKVIIPNEQFDLALIVTVRGNAPVKLGQLVTFDIEVYNQGTLGATDIVVTDYVPAGFDFVGILNPGWTINGGMIQYTIMDKILPNESQIISIDLQVQDANSMTDYVNFAEITAAHDLNGNSPVDEDSTPDAVSNNDKGGEPGGITDNEKDDDGTIDEDDHDPAMVDIFDLALRKTLDFDQTVVIGDELVFTIEIHNQGNISTGGLVVTDYLPTGLSLSPNDPNGWALAANGISKTINQEILPGDMYVAEVLLVVNENAAPGTVTNFAEISSAKDKVGNDVTPYDFDSTPDEINNNDVGGEPKGATDNQITDHGVTDEDDHDPVTLDIFDLALMKTVQETHIVDINTLLHYDFTIYNQGTVDAKEIEFIDHLPNDFIFNPIMNPGWEQIDANTIKYLHSDVLAAGAEILVPLIMTVNNNALGKDLINYGEISSALDVDGNNGRDLDSKPDTDPTNDNGGIVNDVTDNVVNDHGTIDEDDHDPAIVLGQLAAVADIALEKSVEKFHHQAGEDVVFKLVVRNEGEVTFGELTIVDYLPFFLDLNDGTWSYNDVEFYSYITLTAGNGLPVEGLKTGEEVEVFMTTTIKENIPAGPILNIAEIGELIDIDGNDISLDDIDSKADTDPNNDRSANPAEVRANAGAATKPIEDDRAAAEIMICTIERSNTCVCLNNETTADDGQFVEEITITSGPDENWFIDLAQDIYSNASAAPPAAPTAFVTGLGTSYFTETVLIADQISSYRLQARTINNTSYYMIVKNTLDAAHSISGGQECEYDQPGIEGPVNVCVSSRTTHSIIDAKAGATYTWSLPVGGTIVSTTSNSVTIDWAAAIGGPYTLSVTETNPDNCTAPASIEVTIGDQFAFAVSCIGEAQISLGPDCVAQILPQFLLVGGGYDYNSFNVMLTDEHGHVIPGATLTKEHLGKRITAKVINACTGNSCWSYLNVEDKLAPQIECYNDTVTCASMGKYPLPYAVDACDPAPVVTILDEQVEKLNCDREFIKRITRKYVAVDNWGNISDTCTQTIMLKRIALDSIIFPDTFSIANDNSLQCKEYPTDSTGCFPTVEFAGVPMIGDIPLYPFEYYCNVGIDYKDIMLSEHGCVKKMIREWRILEWWCTDSARIITYPQYFEVTDAIAPEINCMTFDTAFKSNGRTCEATIYIPRPVVMDSCTNDDSIKVDLVYPGGIVEDFQGGYITVPVDTHTLLFRAYDNCYNVDSCEVEITVIDHAPPVTICDQFTTVGINDVGYAYIYAETFDDGTYDDCALKLLEVKRMDDGAACDSSWNTFGPYVEFCCADTDSNVMVIFRATDKSGNVNTCMVEVEVQDKIPPVIYCPADDTINCELHYDLSDLSQFGEVEVHDNCGYTYKDTVFEFVNSCREGYLERVFMVSDANNLVTCTQRIYIINDTPFDTSNIDWPWDYETTECREDFLSPDDIPAPYDRPVIDEDFCDLVGVTYKDQVFPYVDQSEACYKILRTWEIINWCRFDSSVTDIWKHEQVIKVTNRVAPVITSDCDDFVKCIYDSCDVGYVDLYATGTDECTEDAELRWEYHLDLGDDGTVEHMGSGKGDSINASGTYRLGNHSIRWVFEDGCGNKTVCKQDFELSNCKAPTAYCKNGLIVDLIAMDLDGDGECDTEMVEIWANDFDAGSFHPCDNPFTISFGKDTSIKSKIFDCDSLGRREITMCVTDDKGSQDCCTTFLIVQDNNNQDCCPRRINKDCVVGPIDINLTDCTQPTDPDDLFSRPVTSSCDVDSVNVTYTDEDGTTGDNCNKIKRTWEVILYFDGVDTMCTYTQCITLDNEFTIDSIIWPSDTLIFEGCNASLDTSNTGGVPVLLGEYCDYVELSLSDEQVEGEDEVCTYWERTWTVANSCDNGKEFEFVQVLVFKNQAPPEFELQLDVLTDNDPGSCGAGVELTPAATSECSAGVTITNDFNGGGADATGFFPSGKTTIIFTAVDTCGNIAMDTVCVTIKDVEPPTVICPPDVSFSCEVDKDTLDYGMIQAMDNCAILKIDIDTIENLNTCGVGTITREITVSDTVGLIATCEQVITFGIDDPFAEGDITWPMDTVTVSSCESTMPDSTGRPVVDITASSCNDIEITFSDSTYAGTCDGDSCMIIERTWTVVDSCQLDMGGGVFMFKQIIEVTDGGVAMATCPRDTTIGCDEDIIDLGRFGLLEFTSSCGVDTTIRDTIYDLNVCNVGTITRTIFGRDSVGNEVQCESVITIEITVPLTEADITWPSDTVEVGTCESISPDSTGRPVVDVSMATCARIAVTFSDSTYDGTCNGDPCTIIERSWIVTDSCQLEMGGGVFTFLQIIEIDGGGSSMATCPRDTTIGCDEDIIDLGRFGTLEYTSTCGIDTIIRDTIYNLNVCNVGTITRTIFGRDTAGHESQCESVITIIITDPLTEVDITWPSDTVEVASCGSTSPDSTGRPVVDITMATCTRVAVTFTDSTYDGTCDGAPCTIIERTWVVTDTCQLDMGGGVFTFKQIIEIDGGGAAQVSCPRDTTIGCDQDLSDLSVFGTLEFTSSCGTDTVIRDTIYDLGLCDIGTITRTILGRDTVGNEVSCQQVITIENLNPLTEALITWPMDTVELDGCSSIDPDSLLNGRPVLDTAMVTCHGIGVFFEDSTSADCMQEPCLIVYRDWTVTDFCQDDGMGGGIFSFRQVIEVNDTTAPDFVLDFIDTTFVAGDSIGCNGEVDELTAGIVTDCGTVTITNNSPHADNAGPDAAGKYPNGVTMFFFFAEDQCCNIDSIPVTVRMDGDTTPPRFRCTKVIKALVDSVAGIKFTAHETVIQASDNCSDSTDLIFSYSPTDMFDSCKIFKCPDLMGMQAPIFPTKIYVFDEAGNVDSCDATIQVLDGADCSRFTSAVIGGKITTPVGLNVSKADVGLMGSGLNNEVTDQLGQFVFSPMAVGGTYEVMPYKNNDPLNGVSTKDLILIQRHLLGNRAFTLPHEYIAADVNHSDNVSARDIVELRRLLLGQYAEFPDNTSWRFTRADHVFPRLDNPWFESWPESYMIDPLVSTMHVELLGIKIGDIDGDANFTGGSTTVRSGVKAKIAMIQDGSEYIFKLLNPEEISGLQFTLDVGNDVSIEDINWNEDAQLEMSNFGLSQIDDGLVAMSWIAPENQTDVVELFRVTIFGDGSESRLTSGIIKSEAYDNELNNLDVVLVDLREEGAVVFNELYQNRPNPFNESTVIGFSLAKEQNATLTIMDMSGRVVLQRGGHFEVGYNEIEIDRNDLNDGGIFYYRLDCDGFSQIRKMINID